MDTFDVRRKRLQALIAETSASIADFAEKHEYSRAQISQYVSPAYNGGRSIGERAARALEQRVGLPAGYLDLPASENRYETFEDRIRGEAEARVAYEASKERIHPIKIIGWAEPDDSGTVTVLPDPKAAPTGMLSADPRAYALRIKGASLRPRYKSGEIITLEPSSVPHPGDDVLLEANDGKKFLAQYLYRRNNELTFGHVNELNGNSVVYEESIRSIAVVTAILPSR